MHPTENRWVPGSIEQVQVQESDVKIRAQIRWNGVKLAPKTDNMELKPSRQSAKNDQHGGKQCQNEPRNLPKHRLRSRIEQRDEKGLPKNTGRGELGPKITPKGCEHAAKIDPKTHRKNVQTM